MTTMEENAFKELKARAEEAEANLIRAAEAGKTLCEELSAVKSVRDELLQENYSLKQSLDAKIALEANLVEELEIYKGASEKAEEKHQATIARLMAQIENQEKSWKIKEQDFESQVDKKEKEIEALKQKLHKLEEDSVKLSCKSPMPLSPATDSTDLYEELEVLRHQLTQLMTQNDELDQDNKELRLQVENLRHEMAEAKEALEERDAELASVMADMGTARNDNLDDIDVNLDVEISSKGNSLFSEVEDRRILVEDQLKKLKSLVEELRQACDIKTKQISKLRAKNLNLMSIASSSGGGASSSTVERLEDLLNVERLRIHALTARLSHYEEKYDEEKRNPAAASSAVADSRPALRRETFFRPPVVVNQANGGSGGADAGGAHDDSSLELQVRELMRLNMSIDAKIQDLTQQLTTLEKKYNKQVVENLDLKHKIQLMKEKPSNSDDIGEVKERKKLEKVVERLEDCPVLVEKAIDENIAEMNFGKPEDGFNSDPSRPDPESSSSVYRPCKSRKLRKVKHQETGTDGEPRKSVRFAEDESEAKEATGAAGSGEAESHKENVDPNEDEPSPPKKPAMPTTTKRTESRQRRQVDFIDAEKESQKMEEQCIQQ